MKEIWLFGAMKFQGNPKFLFLYLNHYYPNIDTYWVADTEQQVDYINELGYRSVLINSAASDKLFSMAKVYVVENFRESLPDTINPNITIANLWHGVGLKHIEFGLDRTSPLTDSVVRKNIRNYPMFHNNLAFLSTSKFMEQHFAEEMRLSSDQFVRGPYPRNIVAGDIRLATFDHTEVSGRNLDKFNEIILFSPTYRDSAERISLFTLFEDVELLKSTLQNKNALFIFKMHHFEEKNPDYLEFKRQHQSCENFLFWEENYDIYEIFDKITTGVVDYSSIYYDLLQAGVKNFIRYVPDLEIYNQTRGIKFDYLTHSGGSIAYTFNQFIQQLNAKSNPVENKEELLELFFGFDEQNKTTEERMSNLIEAIRSFKLPQKKYKTLYSFDIFDTLIRRKNVEPVSIFYAIKERMKTSKLNFSDYLIENYPQVRQDIENDLRDVYRKTIFERQSEKIEINFDELFERLADNFKLNKKQITFLKETEIELEINSVLPITSRIEQLFRHHEEGNDIILISDMYLPKKVIRKMLKQADPRLNKFKLYLSSDVGDQKSTGKLYKHIFFDLDYQYEKWVHFGDNNHADNLVPQRFGIQTRHHQMNNYLGYEKGVFNAMKNYSGYEVAGLLNRKRWSLIEQDKMQFSQIAYYAYSYVGAFYVPYVLWAVKDAVERGYQTIYFISRDGHYLKAIADEIIRVRKYPIKTKFIYGSRKAWRLAAQIDRIDDEFFEPFGLFTVINSYEELIRASQLPEQELLAIIPQIQNFKYAESFKGDVIKEIRHLFASSEVYRQRLLEIGASQRKLVKEYLAQEIDFDEKFTFVEYWGRGYTQDLLARLLTHTAGREISTPCYYIRNYTGNMASSIRHRFMQAPINYTFVEAVFATTPYKSIPGYRYNPNTNLVEAIVEPQDNEFHAIISNEIVNFARDFMALNLPNEDSVSRVFAEYAFRYQLRNPLDSFVVGVYSCFKDNVNSFGDINEVSPAFSMDLVEQNSVAYLKTLTANLDTSIIKSVPEVQSLLLEKCKLEGLDYKQLPKVTNVFPANHLSNYIALNTLPAFITLPKNHAVHNSIIFNESSKLKYTFLKGSIVKVIDIVWMTGGVPRLLTEYGYITAHKDFVAQAPSSVIQEKIKFGRSEVLGKPVQANNGERMLALNDVLVYADPILQILADKPNVINKRRDFIALGMEHHKNAPAAIKVENGYVRATTSYVNKYTLSAVLIDQLYGHNIMILKALPIYADTALKIKTNSTAEIYSRFDKVKPEVHNERLLLPVIGGYIELRHENVHRIRSDLGAYLFNTGGKPIRALSALKVYEDLNFTKVANFRVKRGTIFTPRSIEWTEKGTPRFKIEGGFVTTNKKFIEIADKISLLDKIKMKLSKASSKK